MRLFDIFSGISAMFSKAKNDVQFKNLTKENLLANIEDSKWELTIVSNAWSEFSDKELNSLYDRAIAKLSTDTSIYKDLGKETSEALMDLPKHLQGRAKSLGLMKSIVNANKIVIKLYDDIRSNIDKVFNDESYIIINDMQVSHSMFLGALAGANLYTRFVTNLLATISHILYLTEDGKLTCPKYITEYIGENSKSFTNVLNDVTNAQGKFSVINDITNIRHRGADFKLSSNTSVESRAITSILGIENIFINFFYIAMSPIILIGTAYVDMRHEHYSKIKETKLWLESHTALLKMGLENKDPNSAEYVKTKKIISYYEDKIATLDKKIQHYQVPFT